MKKKTNPLLIFALIALIFASPIFIARYLYQHANQFHFTRSNHGTLLSQPLSATPTLFTAQQPRLDGWLLVYSPASQNCPRKLDSENLTILKNLKKALNKDSSRVTVVLRASSRCLARFNETTITQTSVKHDQLSTHLTSAQLTKEFSAWPTLCIVDPHQNIVMYYTGIELRPVEIYQDLKQLLKASRIG